MGLALTLTPYVIQCEAAISISQEMDALVRSLGIRTKTLDAKYSLSEGVRCGRDKGKGGEKSPGLVRLPRVRHGYGSYADARHKHVYPQDRLMLLNQSTKSDGQIRLEQSLKLLKQDMETSTRSHALRLGVTADDLRDTGPPSVAGNKSNYLGKVTNVSAMRSLQDTFSKTLARSIADAQRAGVITLLDDSEATEVDIEPKA